MSLSLLGASWGLSWLGLELLSARHLQTGFANNWLKVLSFVISSKCLTVGGRLIFLGYQLQG